MGHNNNINAIINFLEDQDRSYQLAKKDSDRDRIENTTRIYMDDVDDNLYLKLSGGSATGLFGMGHSFNQDMAISLMELRRILLKV